MQVKSFPTHLAIICDGNRRWAKKRGLPSFMGHKYAVENILEPLIDHANDLGIKYLTFWVFSTENWRRDKKEVDFLMNLFRQFFDQQIQRLHEKNIRVKVIGNRSLLPKDIWAKVVKGEKLTANNSEITVIMALSYGGRDEIIRSIRKLVAERLLEVLANPNGFGDQDRLKNICNADGVDESNLLNIGKDGFIDYLDTARIPDPDLIVRTGGEQRTSGFLLWQSEYSEWYFPKWHFPDFKPEKLDECVKEFQSRQRRFGK